MSIIKSEYVKSKKVQEIIGAVKSGVDLENAARLGGLPVGAVFGWLERGRLEQNRQVEGIAPNDGEEFYLLLWEAISQARAEAITRNVMAIQTAATEEWRAAAWWLERAEPYVYGGKRTADLPNPKTLGAGS